MSLFDWVSSFMDERAIIEASAIVVGSSFSALFYYLYHRTESRANKVKNALVLDIDGNLAKLVKESPHSKIPYAVVSGYVQPSHKAIICNADSSIKGVIWRKKTTEHKDVYQRYTKTWNNTTHDVSFMSDNVSFELQGQENLAVKLMNPLESAWIEDTVEVVHQKFSPTPANSVMDNIVGYMSGDKLKGYTETESMLRVGTKLSAIGELIFDDNVIKLQPPVGSSKDYIISKLTQNEIILYIQKKAKIFRVFAFLLAAATVTGVYFFVRRMRKRYRALQEEQRRYDELNDIRHQRTTVAGRLNRERLVNEGQEPCIACLTNPRECVLLDCGHICMCVDCLERIPSPKECPVCRSPIVRTVPLYSA